MGADAVVMDMPVGPGTKLTTPGQARTLAKDLIDLGERLGIRVECAMTFGGSPVGRTIGPALEVKEALTVLENKRRTQQPQGEEPLPGGNIAGDGGRGRTGERATAPRKISSPAERLWRS